MDEENVLNGKLQLFCSKGFVSNLDSISKYLDELSQYQDRDTLSTEEAEHILMLACNFHHKYAMLMTNLSAKRLINSGSVISILQSLKIPEKAPEMYDVCTQC